MASLVDRVGTIVAAAGISGFTALAIFASRTGSGERFLEGFAVVVLASLPGWLFVRFMVFRAGALWTEYVLNLHRLGMDDHANLPEPPAASGYHVLWAQAGGPSRSTQNIYRQKFEAYYGRAVGTSDGSEANPLNLKTLPPVLLATTVFAAGWCAVLARDPLFSGPLEVPIDALRFGFMGSYVFVVQMLIRRFFQSDLKPSAYFAAVARVVTVLVVVLVVHHAGPVVHPMSAGAEAATAFVIGFFPLLGMQIVQKAVSLPFKPLMPTLKTTYPLSDLDGLNIWYEARLLEEGIEDLQNLVTGNLVDIILHTRVPVERLVDWIDQGALQLHLDPPNGKQKRSHTDRTALRRLGVRTATDLETMFLPGDRLARRASRTTVPGLDDGTFITGMRTALASGTGPNVTEALLRTFSNLPNLVHVRHWRDIHCTDHHLPPAGAPAAPDHVPPAPEASEQPAGPQPEALVG